MWSSIFKTTLFAGSLDMAAACISNYLTNKVVPGRVLQFIASGVFGKKAFTGGYAMMAWGLVFHFIIAFACTAVFFLLYPRLKFLWNRIWWSSALIGLMAWAVTNLIIIPASHTPPVPFTVSGVTRAVVILIACIGLPISWMADRYYKGAELQKLNKALLK